MKPSFTPHNKASLRRDKEDLFQIFKHNVTCEHGSYSASRKDRIILQSACHILTISYFPKSWMLKTSRNVAVFMPLLERLDRLTPATFKAICLASWEGTHFQTSRSTAGRLWFRAAYRITCISPLPSCKLTPTLGIAFSEEMLKNLCLHHFQQG